MVTVLCETEALTLVESGRSLLCFLAWLLVLCVCFFCCKDVILNCTQLSDLVVLGDILYFRS